MEKKKVYKIFFFSVFQWLEMLKKNLYDEKKYFSQSFTVCKVKEK